MQYKINEDIKITACDERYIGKYFPSKSGEKFKVLGISSVSATRIKKYLCTFEDKTLVIAQGGNIVRGKVVKPIKGLSKEGREALDSVSKKEVIVKEGKEERKPKYEKNGKIYTIFTKHENVSISEDKLRELMQLYCIGKLSMNKCSRILGLTRSEFFAVKTAFSITKDSIPFISEDIDSMSVEEMATATNTIKCKLYEKKLEDDKYDNIEKRIKMYDKKNYFTNKLIDAMIPHIDKVNEFRVHQCGDAHTEGIIQLSDIHFAEVVNLEENQYNMDIAERRLEELFTKAIRLFKKSNVGTINLLFTGDLSNLSLVHMDKKNSEETSRALAITRLFGKLASFVEHMLKQGFAVRLAGILGNESRMTDTFSAIDEYAADNYDYILFQLLKAKFGDNCRVKFLNNCDKLQDVVTINGKNILLIHGESLKQGQLLKEIESLKAIWFNKTGVVLDYTLLGHIHSSYISNEFARSASMVGANSYSSHKLGIVKSFASQNVGLISGDCISFRAVNLK